MWANPADLVKAASGGPLGITALCILLICFLAIHFFVKAHISIRVCAWMLIIVCVFVLLAHVLPNETKSPQTSQLPPDQKPNSVSPQTGPSLTMPIEPNSVSPAPMNRKETRAINPEPPKRVAPIQGMKGSPGGVQIAGDNNAPVTTNVNTDREVDSKALESARGLGSKGVRADPF